MANLIREQRLIDSTKRALIKYVFISDGTNESNTILVNASTLNFALNTNGYIMSSNTDPRSNYRTAIKRIFGVSHLKNNGYVKLQWEGSANSEIITFNDSVFDIDFNSMGDGAVITNPETNPTGDILISTASFAVGDNFTLFIDLRKDNRDYDAGQTADPKAFNRPSGI